MLRRIAITAAINTVLLFLNPALAGEAGRVVFVDGDARVAGNPAAVGTAVNEGEPLQTGAKGHLYIKTVDNGFFVLRPASSGRIVSYQIDTEQPDNTRIKLELTEGVARHISGDAVKQARQNFRLNTPVAAIGVRGTDFTVFTTNDTSRVVVLSGGVVVSPFSGACTLAGNGPCEGTFSRELFASQANQVLQVSRGQEATQLLRGSKHSPDRIAPPRADEPGSANSYGTDGAKTSSDLDLIPAKSGSLANFVALPVIPLVPLVPLVPVVPPPVVPRPDVPKAQPLAWGRWEAVLGQEKQIDVVALLQSHQLVATNAYYALLRSNEGTWQRPEQGSMGFSLQSAQAAIVDERTRTVSAAGVENGKLQLDFVKSTFSTQFDLVSQSERFKLQSQGDITADGKLSGNYQFMSPTNMAVQGVINSDNASAAYLFQSRLDDARVASGATHWVR
jgi:hypothetical protein